MSYLESIPEDLTPIQRLLSEAKLQYINETRNPRISDNRFARILGVSAASFNHWINGTREPDFANVVKLSRSKYIGEKIYNALGYDKPVLPTNATPELSFLAENWELLGRDAQKTLFTAAKEFLDGNKRAATEALAEGGYAR